MRLFPRWRITTFRFNQTALVVADLADSAARQVLITNCFEPEFFAIAESFLIPGTAMLDVGANNGFCTYGLASRNSGDKMAFHLFEANHHLSEILKLSSRLYPFQAICVNNACVTDQPGFSMLKINDNHWGGSYITSKEAGQKVNNIILDDYLKENLIGTVSFLKLDVEGFEMHALRGLEMSIREGKIGAIYIECSEENLHRQGENVDALLNLLRDYGCGLFWCKEQDFERGFTQNERDYNPVVGKGAVRLSPISAFPANYQTDIIAICAKGPHAHLLES